MNKKGDLVNQALELIIAVIGIALVIVAIVLVYRTHVNEENESAKTVINFVEGKINLLKDGQKTEFIVQGFSPKDSDYSWILTRWNAEKGGIATQYRPDKCFFQSCICICKVERDTYAEIAFDFIFTSAADKLVEVTKEVSAACQENGFCRNFGNSTIYFPGGGINTKGFVALTVDKTDKGAICIGAKGVGSDKAMISFSCVKNP